MKKIWTLAQIAREFGVSKERAWVWWRDARLPHDVEDQEGRPYWTRLPRRPPPMPPGRKKQQS